MTSLNDPSSSNEKRPGPDADPNRTELLPPPGSTSNARRPAGKQKPTSSLVRGVRYAKQRLEEILNADIEEISSRRFIALVYLVKVIREAIKTTARDQIMIRAQALSYKTILSLVPVITVLMAFLSIRQLSDKRDTFIFNIASMLVPGSEVKNDSPTTPVDADSPVSASSDTPQPLQFQPNDIVSFTIPLSETGVLPAISGTTGYGIVAESDKTRGNVLILVLGRSAKHPDALLSPDSDDDRYVRLSVEDYQVRLENRKRFTLFREDEYIRISASDLYRLAPDAERHYRYDPNPATKEKTDPIKSDTDEVLAINNSDRKLFLIVQKTPLARGDGFLFLSDMTDTRVSIRIPMSHMSVNILYKSLGVGSNGLFTAQFLSQIENLTANAGAVGLIGFIFLLLTVSMVLGTIEESLNHIWGVSRGRDFFQRLALFTAIVCWGPLFLLLIFSLPGYLAATLPANLPAISFILRYLLPPLLTSVAFSIAYRILPNTKVKWRAAIIGGVIGGVSWVICWLLFAHYVSKFSSYSKVYGSLGLVPMLMVWIWLSWFIILLGSEIAFVIQNFKEIEKRASIERRAMLHPLYYAMRIMLEIARRFKEGRQSEPLIDDLAETLGIPEYSVRGICDTLVSKKIALQIGADGAAFAPARELSALTVHDIIDAVRGDAYSVSAGIDDVEHQFIKRIFDDLDAGEKTRGRALSFDSMIEDLAEKGVGMTRAQRQTALTARIPTEEPGA